MISNFKIFVKNDKETFKIKIKEKKLEFIIL